MDTTALLKAPAQALLAAAVPTAPAEPCAPRPLVPSFTRLGTGITRLDGLLGGGYPGGAATLLYGSPFCGKIVLQQAAFVAAAVRGVPATFILHGLSAETLSRRLNALDPRFAAAEQSGLVTYVDVHSHFLGEPSTHPNALQVDDPHDATKLIKALEERPGFRAGPGLLAIQSASTILMDLGPAKAFQYLRTVLGRVLRSGGVGLVCLQAGMHSETDVQMAKHLCAGMLELRKKGDAHVLRVEGLETTVRTGWIEYEFTPRTFRLTGSFATRTIH